MVNTVKALDYARNWGYALRDAVRRARFLNPALIVVVGLPGSGKSTLVKNEFSDYYVVDPQHWFDTNGGYSADSAQQQKAEAWCGTLLRRLLTEKVRAVVVGAFTVETVACFAAMTTDCVCIIDMYDGGMLDDAMLSARSTNAVPAEVISDLRAHWHDY